MCGLCEKKFCHKCHIERHDNQEHKCNEDDVKTVNLMNNDTKPCPKCFVPIYKIDGCDQMYCVKCYTAFSWKTGRIETGRIHNPHYYEIQRKLNNGYVMREPGDRVGDGCENIELLTFMNLLKFVKDRDKRTKLSTINREADHIRYVELRMYETDEGLFRREYQNLRVKYLMQDIDEYNWKKDIKKILKKKMKNKEVSDVLTMYVDISLDNIRRFCMDTSEESVNNILLTMEKVKKYVNKSLSNISDRFNNKVPYISSSFEIRF